MAKLSHVDDNNRPSMVDVGGKAVTAREAHARTVVVLPEAVLAALDGDEIRSKKGPVFATAIILVLVPCLYMVLEDLRISARFDQSVRQALP